MVGQAKQTCRAKHSAKSTVHLDFDFDSSANDGTLTVDVSSKSKLEAPILREDVSSFVSQWLSSASTKRTAANVTRLDTLPRGSINPYKFVAKFKIAESGAESDEDCRPCCRKPCKNRNRRRLRNPNATTRPIDCKYETIVGGCTPCKVNQKQCTSYKVFNGPQNNGENCPKEYAGWEEWPKVSIGSDIVWTKQKCMPCRNFTDQKVGSWHEFCPFIPKRYGYPDPNGHFDTQDIYRELIVEEVFGELSDQGKNILVGVCLSWVLMIEKACRVWMFSRDILLFESCRYFFAARFSDHKVHAKPRGPIEK